MATLTYQQLKKNNVVDNHFSVTEKLFEYYLLQPWFIFCSVSVLCIYVTRAIM